jgi:hypothetical protein
VEPVFVSDNPKLPSACGPSYGLDPQSDGIGGEDEIPLAFIQHGRSAAATEATRVSGSRPFSVGELIRRLNETRITDILKSIPLAYWCECDGMGYVGKA